MNVIEKETHSVQDYLIDHPNMRRWLRWIGIFFVEAISGFIFAFGFRAFIKPTSACVQYWQTYEMNTRGKSTITDLDIHSPSTFISGGASGMAQVILAIVSIFTHVPNDMQTLLVSLLYLAVNIPLFVLAFAKISKQFAIFTLVNVGFVSLFQYVIPDSWIYLTVDLYDDLIARVIFGGLTTGASSGLAMLVGTSGGGSDIVTIYFSEKKSTSAGKYSLLFNTIIVLAYVLFSCIGNAVSPEWNTRDRNDIITKTLYTLIYFFVSSKVIDLLNTKNRKQEVQIFTTDADLPQILIRSFPHSCTVVESKGAFSGKRNYMIYMVISKSETRKTKKILHEYDPKAFFTVTDLNQVYGRFYIRSIDE